MNQVYLWDQICITGILVGLLTAPVYFADLQVFLEVNFEVLAPLSVYVLRTPSLGVSQANVNCNYVWLITHVICRKSFQILDNIK